MAAEVTVPSPLAEMVTVWGSGLCSLNGTSLRFRRTWVMSSQTPGRVVNSCMTPLMRTLVTAAPWMLLSSTRRRLCPTVVAKPRSKG
jgi:hypothetical protein